MNDIFEKIWNLNKAGYSVCFEPIDSNKCVRVNVKSSSGSKCMQISSMGLFSSKHIIFCLNEIMDELKKQDEVLNTILEDFNK